MRTRVPRATAVLVGLGLTAAWAPAVATTDSTAATTVDCSWASPGVPLEQAFTRAGQEAGVPAELVKAVSYLQSRWDDHGGRPSADGGYGPMNLTDLAVASGDKGDGSSSRPAASSQTARLGARLTGLPLSRVKTDPVANVCAGAAVLASYQDTPSPDVNDWREAVARYGGSSRELARQVFTTLRHGESRVTDRGDTVTLAAQSQATVPAAPQAAAGTGRTDCPVVLACEWVPAPYEKGDPAEPDSTSSYGNHDIADRTGRGGPRLRYIVIHDTEATYDGSLDLVQDPTYVAWNYTVRSSDGHIAQHLDAKDVGWHAGNWYVNMHSIGIEHEGKGGNGGWFTEAMYQRSATLVRHLARKYDIPLDPAHVIGHDQVPGTTAGATASVHWDPGPYWDWEHYFELLRAPIAGKARPTSGVKVGDVVTVKPGYAGNPQTLTQCEEQSPGSGPCRVGAPTNFATLHQGPSATSPLAKDVGTHPTGSPDGTTSVNDVSARAQAGNRLVVAALQDDWVQVSWSGELAWIHNPAARPVLVRTPGATVTVRPGATSAPVYGRAYPEESAYPSTVPYQSVSPVEYTLKPGQAYALTDRRVVTDYYRATTYDGSAPGDRTDVRGRDVYYQLALNHRIFYVRAADVQVHEPGRLVNRSRPRVQGRPQVGQRLTALPGTWSGGAPASLAHRWFRDGRPVAGARSATYVVGRRDVGHRLAVVVTASAPNAKDVRATSRSVRIRR
ncbi:N-acetylmuramoyl-L-alanine amidase [Aeromicrobium chenweiae]|uniref:N-acetylmuramoyl-L-alanine amidase n=1 Tax=Aeromicrobium chenweiae TaxID=2079793 RepID=A0A2S0WJV7_9ACTN|nr:peptidoglycan recognition family protein [Aeromicrobium chenweiae]AWB91577.1 N-acetylmuramoyl-L-alanine amidase [Aeromicrobium chenweiae]TGN32413.1 N-acetylmuramoyl-L-alanine amidase [Aeromicrobium chenweiae]